MRHKPKVWLVSQLLIVSKDASIGANPVTKEERIRYYSGLIALTADYPEGEVQKAATAYYAQVPRPRDFYVGLIDGTNTAATATSSNTPDLSVLQAVTAGGFSISIDGTLTQ